MDLKIANVTERAETRSETPKDTFRKEYTPLGEVQKIEVKAIKEGAEALEEIFDSAVPRDRRSEKSRCMALARTNLEQAVMWAVKAATTKEE